MSQATMDTPTPTLEIVLKDINEGRHIPDPNKKIRVELTVPETDLPKLHAWMHSDTHEKAEAVRNAGIEECTESLEYVVNYAAREYGSGAKVFATFLASLYNGNRVKADVSDIGALDACNFEHLMNVLRLCFATHQEPHSFFKNGNAIFEGIIKRHGLEKRRKS
jgi:hypothetical protein